MKLSKLYSYILIVISFLISGGFFSLYVFRENIGFLFDTFLFIIIALFYLYLFYKKIYFSKEIFFGLSGFQILHYFGHLIIIEGVRLYDSWIIQNILKFDNILHFWSGVLLTFIVFSIISKKTKLNEKNQIYFYLIMILLVCGLGAIHEIIELIAVFVFDIQNEIGGYINNILDLVFNLIGTLFASMIIHIELHGFHLK